MLENPHLLNLDIW